MESYVESFVMFPSCPIRITFIGPIAEIGVPPRGGYQACNRRTITALRAHNIVVREMPYPEPNGSSFNKAKCYLFGFTNLCWNLIFDRNNIVHITGLYKHFIYYELILVLLSRMKGCEVIYDIRAGSARLYYAKKTFLYRWAFRTTLQRATTVMVEGEEYICFVQELVGKDPFLLPNHVSFSCAEGIGRSDPVIMTGELVLVYVGRIIASKGIDIVLEVAATLRRNGCDVLLKIIGDGDNAYVRDLRKQYVDSRNKWLGPLAPESVMKSLLTSHFFLFPSSHPGEGHSNALTESMAAGCVPVASLNGFNQSVISDCGRVLPQDADASVYATAILEILLNNQWANLSFKAKQRAYNCFESDRVVGKLISYYSKLVEVVCH